jgi:hypothetical protein
MKKIIEFFKKKKIVKKEETPLMLNKKYLEKISGRKQKCKSKLRNSILRVYFWIGVNVIGIPNMHCIMIYKNEIINVIYKKR